MTKNRFAFQIGIWILSTMISMINQVALAQNSAVKFDRSKFADAIHKSRASLPGIKVYGHYEDHVQKQTLNNGVQISKHTNKPVNFLSAFQGEKRYHVESAHSPEELKKKNKTLEDKDVEWISKSQYNGQVSMMYAGREGFMKSPIQVSLSHRFSALVGVYEMGFSTAALGPSLENEIRSGKLNFVKTRIDSKFGRVYDFSETVASSKIMVSVAPEFDYLVVHTVHEFPAFGKKIQNLTDLTKISKVGVHWIPMETRGGGSVLNGIRTASDIRVIKIDKRSTGTLPDTLFELSVPPGSTVGDELYYWQLIFFKIVYHQCR